MTHDSLHILIDETLLTCILNKVMLRDQLVECFEIKEFVFFKLEFRKTYKNSHLNNFA